MERVTMQVGGVSYMLAQGQDAPRLKNEVVTAARSGADFVTVTVFGNRSLDVLVTPGVAITFESETVDFDPRDDGDLSAPFDSAGFDDYLTEH